MPNTIIIPIPIEHTRDCIIVEGKRYCEDETMTMRETGILIIAVVILLCWILGGLYFLIEKDNPRMATIYFLVPPTLIGIMLLFGK